MSIYTLIEALDLITMEPRTKRKRTGSNRITKIDNPNFDSYNKDELLHYRELMTINKTYLTNADNLFTILQTDELTQTRVNELDAYFTEYYDVINEFENKYKLTENEEPLILGQIDDILDKIEEVFEIIEEIKAEINKDYEDEQNLADLINDLSLQAYTAVQAGYVYAKYILGKGIDFIKQGTKQTAAFLKKLSAKAVEFVRAGANFIKRIKNIKNFLANNKLVIFTQVVKKLLGKLIKKIKDGLVFVTAEIAKVKIVKNLAQLILTSNPMLALVYDVYSDIKKG